MHKHKKHHKKFKAKSHKKFKHKKQFKKRSPLAKLFYKLNRFVRRHPLISSIISILIGVFLIRAVFINSLFGNDMSEFKGWLIFFAILFIIIGIIALKVWFRRNVPSLFTKHNVNWRNK